MSVYEIPRTGLPPLRFEGELVAEANDAPAVTNPERKDSKRPWRAWAHLHWNNVRVYQTKGGSFVVAIAYRNIFRAEQGRDDAYVCGNQAEVIATLRDHDPTQHAIPGAAARHNWAARMPAIHEGMRQRYAAQLAKVFAQMGISEEVE